MIVPLGLFFLASLLSIRGKAWTNRAVERKKKIVAEIFMNESSVGAENRVGVGRRGSDKGGLMGGGLAMVFLFILSLLYLCCS